MAPEGPGSGWSTPLRRGVGGQLLDGAQPQYAIASALGGDRANIGRLLVKLEGEGLLVRAGEDADAQRTWRLADGQREQVLAALAAEQPFATLVASQRVIAVGVPADRQDAVARRLRAAERTGSVVWAAKVEGASAQWLLVVSSQAGSLESQRLVAALESVGARCSRMLVEEVMSGEALRRHLAALRQAARSV